ncbi:MAG: hypothetical protein LBQ57_10120 [Spirochaetales bacterium]|nr:hypothetical protein [Spirochaetales bacterium]
MARTCEPQRGLTFDDVWAALMELRESQKKTDRQIGRLGSRLGDLIEHLTASNIIEKFKELNYEFNHISRNHKLKGPDNRILAEIDILLENGDYAMVVEVKSLLTLTDVKEHMKRLETLRRYADIHNDRRKYISSVSGALIEENARDFALDQGIYVLEHPGDTLQILSPEKVRIW